MPQYTISPTAFRDLEDIIDYFTERNVEAGDRLLNEFTKKCRSAAIALKPEYCDRDKFLSNSLN